MKEPKAPRLENIFYNSKTHRVQVPIFIESSTNPGGMQEERLDFKNAALLLTELACGKNTTAEIKNYFEKKQSQQPQLPKSVPEEMRRVIGFFIVAAQTTDLAARQATLGRLEQALEAPLARQKEQADAAAKLEGHA